MLICRNKMPTTCNRYFYCRFYCLLNMFRAPLRPSSGAQEYYTVVAACGISCSGFQVTGLVWSWGLCVRFAGCCASCSVIQCTTVSYCILCSHNTDNVCTTSMYPHWTECIILAKYWLWFPVDGFLVHRNTLQQPP